MKTQHRINNEITAVRVRLVSGEDSREVSIKEALFLANQQELDLVEVAPNAVPPVCKIMDHGKFLYEQKKSTKKQDIQELKEIKIRPGTDEHDYQVKVKHAREFLVEGDKVKVSLRFKGRELSHQDRGHAMLNRIATDLADVAKVESKSRLEFKQLFLILIPGVKK